MCPPLTRSAASHATIYPYGPFAAGDGGTVMLGLQNEREWVIFCKVVLQQPGLATDARFDSNPRRNEHREALKAIILAAFAGMSTAEVTTRPDEAQIANWRQDYNEFRPHSSLGRIPPGRFAELHRQRAGDAAQSQLTTTQID